MNQLFLIAMSVMSLFGSQCPALDLTLEKIKADFDHGTLPSQQALVGLRTGLYLRGKSKLVYGAVLCEGEKTACSETYSPIPTTEHTNPYLMGLSDVERNQLTLAQVKEQNHALCWGNGFLKCVRSFNDGLVYLERDKEGAPVQGGVFDTSVMIPKVSVFLEQGVYCSVDRQTQLLVYPPRNGSQKVSYKLVYGRSVNYLNELSGTTCKLAENCYRAFVQRWHFVPHRCPNTYYDSLIEAIPFGDDSLLVGLYSRAGDYWNSDLGCLSGNYRWLEDLVVTKNNCPPTS